MQEGCPFVGPCAPGNIDVWSARNMHLSPDGGATPAPRREGDLRGDARRLPAAGWSSTASIDIPVIDWRHYLEPFLNMHNAHQSFAARQRHAELRRRRVEPGDLVHRRTAPARAPFDQTPQALHVIDAGCANIAAHPERGVAEQQAGRRGRLLLQRGRVAARAAATTSGTGSSTAADGRVHDRRSRSLGRRGSWPAARSRAASSSASCSPSTRDRARSLRRRGSRRGRASPGWSRSSRRASATTASRTRGCRPSSGTATSRTRERAAASGGRPRTSD